MSYMQLVGTQVFDVWVSQTACFIFKNVFMQQNVFLSAGEWNTVMNYTVN